MYLLRYRCEQINNKIRIFSVKLTWRWKRLTNNLWHFNTVRNRKRHLFSLLQIVKGIDSNWKRVCYDRNTWRTSEIFGGNEFRFTASFMRAIHTAKSHNQLGQIYLKFYYIQSVLGFIKNRL